MKRSTAELLSRSLDGDLSTTERVELEQRLRSDPTLAAELEAMAKLRDAVGRLAAGMEAPEELSALLEPLRRGGAAAGARPHRPARWLAAAATLALAIVVSVEVARRRPTPAVDEIGTHAVSPIATEPADREFFQLQPLPTRDPSSGEELLGATDRLLASPLPEPELAAAPALEVIGPLPMAETPGRADPGPRSDQEREAAPGQGSDAVSLANGALSIGDSELALKLRLPPGSYPVIVTVRSGIIVEAAAADPELPAAEALSRALVGLAIADAADGTQLGHLRVDELGSEARNLD
jgi:hypothetical protein